MLSRKCGRNLEFHLLLLFAITYSWELENVFNSENLSQLLQVRSKYPHLPEMTANAD